MTCGKIERKARAHRNSLDSQPRKTHWTCTLPPLTVGTGDRSDWRWLDADQHRAHGACWGRTCLWRAISLGSRTTRVQANSNGVNEPSDFFQSGGNECASLLTGSFVTNESPCAWRGSSVAGCDAGSGRAVLSSVCQSFGLTRASWRMRRAAALFMAYLVSMVTRGIMPIAKIVIHATDDTSQIRTWYKRVRARCARLLLD